MDTVEQEISLQDIVKVFRKRWRLILIPALLAVILTGAISKLTPKQYESYALIKIGYSGTKPLETAASLSEIMNTLPNLENIAKKVNKSYNGLILKDTVKYEDKAGLLRISARAETPEKAQELVETALVMTMERHRLLFEDAEKRLAYMVKYVRETLRPVPLSSGISELVAQASLIEVAPVLDRTPVKTKTKVMVLMVFFVVLFVDMLIAFYREGTQKQSTL